MQEKNRKLTFQLVPDGCWYSNLRTILNKAQWDYIKKDVKVDAKGVCTICGKKTNRLEAHEVWSYDIKNSTQKLEDVVAICKDCHQAIHIERSRLIGFGERAEDHYCKVNNVSFVEMKQDLSIANKTNQERNKVSEWKIDLTWLKRYTK